jgi:DNA-binding NarL/FixJ family response regulator
MPTEFQSHSRAKTRVFVVEDYPIVREQLLKMIGDEPDLVCCGVADTVATARAGIEEQKPDLVLLDLKLHKQIAMDILTHFRTALPKTRFLVISFFEESLYGERVLKAGARGFVNKAASISEMRLAIRKVVNGELAVSKSLADSIVIRAASGVKSSVDALSARELEVFRLIGEGNSSREVAGIFNLSIKTIETHRDNIKKKLGLKDAAELVHAAINWVNEQQGNA